LDEPFDKSGFALQGIVNEIGRRLGYDVTNGRYQGAVNKPAHDGLWFGGTNHIIVEVKTTDAYRINLDSTNAYVEKAALTGNEPNKTQPILIVVGRLGDLEAQVISEAAATPGPQD
jgi:hypothetical protein